jgi:prepilin-type N-terminal cleavage/methylation domain-containing protein
MKTKQRTPSSTRHGFTLTELLVVITIIVVLAAVVFSISGNVRQKASGAVSVSNLRQIGTAILAHASDNNSKLPGPVLGDNFPRYQNNALSGQLGWHLKDYLSSEAQPTNPQPRTFYTANLDYPAAKTNAKNPKSKPKPTYVVFSRQTDAITGQNFWPLGNYNPNSSGNRTPPMTTIQLASRETRGKPWITEIDQVIRPSTSRYGAEETPPHGNFRNTLMFDFSVRAIPLGEF